MTEKELNNIEDWNQWNWIVSSLYSYLSKHNLGCGGLFSLGTGLFLQNFGDYWTVFDSRQQTIDQRQYTVGPI